MCVSVCPACVRERLSVFMCACVCVRACVQRVRACVRAACPCACMRLRACVRACVRAACPCACVRVRQSCPLPLSPHRIGVAGISSDSEAEETSSGEDSSAEHSASEGAASSTSSSSEAHQCGTVGVLGVRFTGNERYTMHWLSMDGEAVGLTCFDRQEGETSEELAERRRARRFAPIPRRARARARSTIDPRFLQ